MANQKNLFKLKIKDLIEIAKEYKIKDLEKKSKEELIFLIFENQAIQEGLIFVTGVLEIMRDEYGFIRFKENNYKPGNNDVYVSVTQIRKFKLKTGHIVSGPARSPKKGEKYYALLRVNAINHVHPSVLRTVKSFNSLTPYFPKEQLDLEHDPKDLTTRIINLFTPIGKGQRGLIVAAPRTGKTVIMQKISNAILKNYPDVYVIVLLIDERPEEVTDMKQRIKSKNSEVISSTFDRTAKSHIHVSEMVIEKAKRMTELGKDVVIMLDSITRLARAYNNTAPSSGKILSGGVDANSLHKPKKFFGAARNTLEKGSLTILATALINTGSRMDQVIFEEFKGTGNMELVLDRKLSDSRIYPAVELLKSGTRREELILSKLEINRMFIIRKHLKNQDNSDAVELIKKRLDTVKTNKEFFKAINR